VRAQWAETTPKVAIAPVSIEFDEMMIRRSSSTPG